MTLNGKEEKEIQAFLALDLEKAVDQASVASRLGINKLKHVVPIMARFGCQMLIHHRPRSSNMSDHEEFEKMILDLLGNDNGYPLMVVVDAFRKDDFNGEVTNIFSYFFFINLSFIFYLYINIKYFILIGYLRSIRDGNVSTNFRKYTLPLLVLDWSWDI